MTRWFFLLAGLWVGSLGADDASPPKTLAAIDTDTLYETRDIHDRNGIGKFYMGREIARVMGHQGIDWLERDTREQEERLSELIRLLDLAPGDAVADIGAGSGVITLLLANDVGAEGVVYAVDIQTEMLTALEKKLEQTAADQPDRGRVEPVLGTTQSPKLPPASCDLAIMVDVYHEFDFPHEMLTGIIEGLKPGGRVAFVEYRKEDPTVRIKEVHKMSEAQVKKEALRPEHGLRHVITHDELPRQHVVVFEKIVGP